MITTYCRYCHIGIHNHLDYFGYCSIPCCIEFSIENGLTLQTARDVGSSDCDYCSNDKTDLECEVFDLKNECDLLGERCYRLERDYDDDMGEVKGRIEQFKEEIIRLKDLDWNKIKKERQKEAGYIELILRKVKNIRQDNRKIEDKSEEIKRDNELLRDQNLDLLKTLKEMRSYSDRFDQIDFGI